MIRQLKLFPFDFLVHYRNPKEICMRFFLSRCQWGKYGRVIISELTREQCWRSSQVLKKKFERYLHDEREHY